MQTPRPDVHKILVVTLSNLGDVVLTLPVFQSLVRAYPKAQLHAMVGPNARVVLENDTRIHRVMSYDKKISWAGKWRLLRQVRAERYDLIVDLRRSLIGLWGGARFRNDYFDFPAAGMHRRLRHLRSVKGLAPASDESFLKKKGTIPEAPAEQAPALVIAAVGSKSDIKKWPPAHFAALLDRLAIERSCRIVLVGDENDRADAEKVKRLMASPAEDRTGQTGWDGLCALIRSASLVVTNDSAPLHIADSLKVPTLALFGPTDPGKYGPLSPGSAALTRKIFCSPCEKAQCRFDHECMKELGPDEATCKALELLDGRSREEGLKILVMRLDRLGDLVLSLPAIDALRRRFPNARLSVMTRPATRPLLEGHPWIDEVIPYEYEHGGRHRFGRGYFRFLREIVRRRFDAAFVLHPGARSYLLPFLAGIPYRLGYRNRWSFLLSTAVPDRRREGTRHESEYALEIVRAFGVETPPDLEAKLFPSALVGAKLAAEYGQGPWIAIHPGSSCPSKRWDIGRFEELGKRLLQNFPHRLMIIGGREETEFGRRLKNAFGERAVDLTGTLDLKALPALLARCELLVSNDSGPVHVAAAVGTRVISIFGRNQAGLSPRRWRPLGHGHAVIQKDVGCITCLAHNCNIDFECLKAISVDEVFAAVKRLLSKTPVMTSSA